MSRILGYGLAGASALAFAVVVAANWRAALVAMRRPHAPGPSLVFLAGPILLATVVLGLRTAADELAGSTVLAILGVGLAMDPGALPIVVFGLARRFFRRGDAEAE